MASKKWRHIGAEHIYVDKKKINLFETLSENCTNLRNVWIVMIFFFSILLKKYFQCLLFFFLRKASKLDLNSTTAKVIYDKYLSKLTRRELLILLYFNGKNITSPDCRILNLSNLNRACLCFSFFLCVWSTVVPN